MISGCPGYVRISYCVREEMIRRSSGLSRTDGGIQARFLTDKRFFRINTEKSLFRLFFHIGLYENH